MTRTLAPAEQDTLWDLAPAPAVPAQAPPPLKKPNRFHTLGLPAPLRGVCNPRCLVCGRDEDDGLCSPCSVVCSPGGGVVEVCLITRWATARPVGDRLVTVVCPWCDRTHWHSSTSREPVRSGQCGRPYVLRTPQKGLHRTQSGEQGPPAVQSAPRAAQPSQATTAPQALGGAA
ncbi:hypothetical protein [Streptosporangium sp. NPDC002721]|uniref:hypothetical protein n=1 Tax=Streptosporangium sp. NPDC002721 TaxID=3366188 RepID=UPI0036B128CE